MRLNQENMYCLCKDIKEMDVSDSMTTEEHNGEKRHAAPTPNKLGQGQEEE
jgi:hypothetical protein